MTPIEKRLDLRADRYWRLTHGRKIKASVVLIGDRPGPAAPEDQNFLHVPFKSLKHCSGWLNKLLEDANVPEGELAWINAYDKNGQPTPRVLFERVVGQPAVFALGGNAEKWCKENDVRLDTTFAHPQYWKRFKSKHTYPLIDQLVYVTHEW